jgi:hypothetical protein
MKPRGTTRCNHRWSPDSKKIAVMKRRPGYNRQVHYVESSPADQVQPKHRRSYRKPGRGLSMIFLCHNRA